MTSNEKSELDEILDNFTEKQKLINQQIKQKETDESIFLEKFNQIRKNIIRPCLEELSQKLKERGHYCTIFEQEYTRPKLGQSTDKNISLSITPFSDTQQSNTPYITFNADIIKKVISIHGSTMMPGRVGIKGRRGEISITSINKEVVESEVLKLLKESFK